MKLHTHPEEFRELITVVANEKHISESAVERDYYIVMMLKSLADSPYADQCVFKGCQAKRHSHRKLQRPRLFYRKPENGAERAHC